MIEKSPAIRPAQSSLFSHFSISNFWAVAFFLLISSQTIAQESDTLLVLDTIPLVTKDSLITKTFPSDSSLQNLSKEKSLDLMEEVKKEISIAYDNNLKKFESRKNFLIQTELISAAKSEINNLKGILAGAPDFEQIEQELDKFESLLPEILYGVDSYQSELSSERNLTVTSAVLNEVLQKLLEQKKTVDEYAHNLRHSHYKIDSISARPELFYFPLDTLEAIQFSKDIMEISVQTRPIDELLNTRRKELDEIQTGLNELTYSISNWIESIENTRKTVNSNLLEETLPEDPSDEFYHRDFWETIKVSANKEKIAISYYLKLFQTRILVMVLTFLMVWLFISRLKDRTKDSLNLDPTDESHLILNQPIFSALVITTGIFQFFFINPPFIFYWILWFICSVSLTIIFKGYLRSFWMFFWICTVFMFLLSGLVNMILIPSSKEQFAMYGVASIAVIFLVYLVYTKKSQDLKEKRILYFIWLMGIMEFISMAFNFAGRFNLAKAFLVSGYMGIVLGILLLWTVRLINQGLNISNKAYSTPEKDLFFINFEKIGTKAPGIFYFFLASGWVLLIGKNFYSFSQFSRNVNEFLTETRVIGNYAFTINGLFIFVVILFISFLISRLLSLFSADPDAINSEDQRKRISFGSWLLLVQIFVICLGLFLAFAASGIPLDKITIILGALSVGIGLGLQGLVNNLVSGLILAFENTVKVGDLIEIEGRPGTMKSIGFRSSVVNMFEGATVVIPNGELISKQLINWTTGKGRKLAMVVGISYESDLEKAVKLLRGIIAEDSRIRHFPAARVVPIEFADSSIDIEVVVWVNSYFDFPFVQGDIVTKANELFKLNGIKIPFPQTDLHIIPPPNSITKESPSESKNPD